MAYRVKIMPRAQRDPDWIYRWIGAGSSGAALAWYRGLREAIRSLRNNPRRSPATPENAAFRHLLYGAKPHVYRVIYRIVEKQKEVEILHVRHGAMER
jgi:plasmid stabilization system protein ParE